MIRNIIEIQSRNPPTRQVEKSNLEFYWKKYHFLKNLWVQKIHFSQ